MSDGAMGDAAMGDGAAHDGTGGIAGFSGTPSAPGAPGGPHQGLVVVLVCGAVPAALLAAIIAVPAALWSRLPERVADHWTFAGTANGTAPRLVSFLALGALALLGAGLVWLGWAATRKSTRDGVPEHSAGAPEVRAAVVRGRAAAAGTAAAMIPLGLFLTAVGTGSVIMVAVANVGAGGLRAASVGAGVLPALLGGPVLLAGFAGYALRRYGGLGTADSETGRSSLGLRPGERAVWTGRARARWAWPAAVLLVAAGALVGTVTARWGLAVVLLAVGVITLGFTSVRVTVAARGVTVGYGPLGLRLTRIPLSRIASAAAVERTPFSFGYRGSLLLFGAAAVVLRRGPALRLALRDGKTFLVTVDDAATGAALLNDLTAGPPG
jgi:hypothetical protein